MTSSAGYIRRTNDATLSVAMGLVDGMRVEGRIFANDALEQVLRREMSFEMMSQPSFNRSFIPSLVQVANVACLPGIVGHSIAMPDVHSGYGFAVGNVAAFDMDDPNAIVSPGGVGFDINCGVRMLRTNLKEGDIRPVQERLAQSLFNHVPVGVGSRSLLSVQPREVDQILQHGIDWAVREGFAWPEDKENCEDFGRIMGADAASVSAKAKGRGVSQVGTLGAGNHYAEVQIVDEIYDHRAAAAMGLELGTVCAMIHSGSRGLGHQVASEAVAAAEMAMPSQGVLVPDRQLACVRIGSPQGQDYISAMNAAANFAFVNRSIMTFLVRQAFSETFNESPDTLDMQVVYDVSHNIAKEEMHSVNGTTKRLLVHRKGATRAFGPYHPSIPVAYQSIGQPVLVGGTMGTASFVLTGTDKGMQTTFGSTCHGAGRALSRSQCRKLLNSSDIAAKLREANVSVRVASPQLLAEEAPQSYKDVFDVVDTCQRAGISSPAVRLKPVAVAKG
eukprot:Plantae.Rhodophyta-Purpureofilum_apyrenoidigerum.ctg14804.p1 GENE.Plantae.Rhodophyta-Purpureofilum_apyrenoidigerum.ctg14804~~Plantae.Rhodophyta-Purpureofilum_apyrenoidigerum.ctg14804.p1  ORF type:complete len:503 (-),score=57.47 Plantae.Rhodophyta-Purpureofilum_apyrenoidigerum.ctg14804:169-1677(-)